MKGDFTRDTFDPAQHFRRVLMQQGRVTLDADFNEQMAILLESIRQLTVDLIGPCAAPEVDPGFGLGLDDDGGITIGRGRYYVDGIAVVNDGDYPFTDQPFFKPANPFPDSPAKDASLWFYLDVWERLITSIEDDDIREKALNGPDTCARSKVVWQVRSLDLSQLPKESKDEKSVQELEDAIAKETDPEEKEKLAEQLQLLAQGKPETPPDPAWSECVAPLGFLDQDPPRMAVRLDPGLKDPDPCNIPPDSRYRGLENHLYRVEIHDPGRPKENGGWEDPPTFKWSRDNGSVVTSWRSGEGGTIEVGNTRGFSAGNWVELSDDWNDLNGQPGCLVLVTRVEGTTLTLDTKSVPSEGLPAWNKAAHPKVRRWDQTRALTHGVVPIDEGETDSDWIDLEDGIQIRFAPPVDDDHPRQYRTGDYWLIPARVASGALEWPHEESEAVRPHGVQHHYAPLGFFKWDGTEWSGTSCTCHFGPISVCEPKATAKKSGPSKTTRVPVHRPAPKGKTPARKKHT